MKLRRNSIHIFLLLLILAQPGLLKGQKAPGIEEYSKKYPNNSVILTSLKEDLNIEMAGGKPLLEVSEYKEYLALNENAIFFADTKEKFGSIYKFKDIEAYTLVPEKGGYLKIPVKNFNKTTEISDNLFYDDITDYNFTFPSVVKGARMVSRINMSSDDPSFEHRFYFGNYFPGEEYVFTVTCPKNVEIKYKIFGRDTSDIKFSLLIKGGKKIYTWQTSNPKAYIKDEYAPDGDYYVPHIIVQVRKYSYKEKTTSVNGSLDDLYRISYNRISKINTSGLEAVKALADSITKGIASNKEKVRKIYAWVQDNIKYVAFEDGENGFVPREASLVMQRKYGDCKDKTSILVAMLKSQGLNASYTWVGTRDIPYKISEFPSVYDFNHMIAVWWDDNNNPVVLDGTTLHYELEVTPSSIQGKECLIERGLENYKVYKIPVASPSKNSMYDSLVIELKRDTLVGRGFCIASGEMKSFILNHFDGKDRKDLPEVVSNINPKASNKFIIKSVDPISAAGNDSVFKYGYKFLLPDYLTSYKNVLYLNMNLDRFLAGINLKEDRWIPVELRKTEKHAFVCTFKIPAGYEARDIPNNSSYVNNQFGYTHSYKLKRNEITVKTVLTLNFQVLEGNSISQFREMLDQLNTDYIQTIPIYKTTTR